MEYGETQMSVKWLESKIQKEIATYGSISPKLISIFAEQAKAIHKQECIKYYVDGVDYGDMGQHIRESLIQIAEKIYNETFGGNNEQK